MFIGFTGKAFDKDTTVEVGVGETFRVGGYEMKIREIVDGENDELRVASRQDRRARERKGRQDTGAGAPRLQSQPSADIRSRHLAKAERRCVRELCRVGAEGDKRASSRRTSSRSSPGSGSASGC